MGLFHHTDTSTRTGTPAVTGNAVRDAEIRKSFSLVFGSPSKVGSLVDEEAVGEVEAVLATWLPLFALLPFGKGGHVVPVADPLPLRLTEHFPPDPVLLMVAAQACRPLVRREKVFEPELGLDQRLHSVLHLLCEDVKQVATFLHTLVLGIRPSQRVGRNANAAIFNSVIILGTILWA